MSERRLIFLAESLKSQCSKERGKGMFKAFCKTSLFSCLKLHFLKPLLGFYSEDWRQTVGFSWVPLIAKQKTLYWENMYFCKQLTQQSLLSYSSAVLQCGNGIILQNFWCLIRERFMKEPLPPGGALAKSIFTPWLPICELCLLLPHSNLAEISQNVQMLLGRN